LRTAPQEHMARTPTSQPLTTLPQYNGMHSIDAHLNAVTVRLNAR
jgi:hypothetical protein